MPKIVVVGCGVSGLSSALQLQDAGFDVTIISRDMPHNTTSVAAGAVWYGGGTRGKARQWASITLKHFQDVEQNQDSGVHIIRLREVFPHPVADPWYKDRLPYFRHMTEDELPDGLIAGFLMDVPLVECPLYLQVMSNQFEANGGTFDIREIETLDDLKDDYPLVVNCTGVWARQVADDPSVYPIRGQTTVVDAPQVTQGYMDDASFTYLFPRGDGVLMGGVAQAHNWDLDIDPRVTDDILARCMQVEPTVEYAEIVKQFVGLRPGRPQVRLETEALSGNCMLIHNYGHAGIGYTLSWGCASDVTRLAKQISNISD